MPPGQHQRDVESGLSTQQPLLAASAPALAAAPAAAPAPAPPTAPTMAAAPPKWSGSRAGAHLPFTSWQRKLYGVGGGGIVPADEVSILGFPRRFFCLGAAADESEMVQLSRGSILALLAQVMVAVLLATVSIHTTATVADSNATMVAPSDDGSSGAELVGTVVTAADVAWTKVRCIFFLSFISLTVAQRWLVLSVSRHDPIALAVRRQELSQQVLSLRLHVTSSVRVHKLWTCEVPEETESMAAQLCAQLWLPLAVGAVALFILDAAEPNASDTTFRLLAVMASDLFPVANIAATTLLLSTQCAVVRRHVENVVQPFAGAAPLPEPFYMRLLQRPGHRSSTSTSTSNTSSSSSGGPIGASRMTVNELVVEFRSISTELAYISSSWSWILGVQVCLFCSLLGNATATLLHFHGVSLLTGTALSSGGAKLWLVQTLPVLWALMLSFDSVVFLNTYLADVPGRISRHCDTDTLTLSERCQFADEYQRLAVWLSAPFVGELTADKRFGAAVSFAGMISLALAFPSQITGFLASW